MARGVLLAPRAENGAGRARISRVTAESSELVAAGRRVTAAESEVTRRYTQEWQSRALFYHDNIPEVHFASQFYERYLKSVRLFVAKRDDSGEIEEVEESHPATEFLSRIQDPGGGGTSGWQGAYGRLKFLIGEGLLAVTETEDGEAWEFLSPFELQPTGSGTYRRISAPGLSVEYRNSDAEEDETLEPGEIIAYRLWTPHPRYSRLADSPMLATMQICEELMKLTDVVRARAVSRLAGNGVLFMPEGYSFAPPTTEGDENSETDPFRDLFQQHQLAPIENPGTAAAVVPLIVWGPSEINGKTMSEVIFHLKTHDAGDAYPEKDLRMEAVRRFAIGADFPPEVLLGLSEANHWGAWVVDETTARAYIFPVCQSLCDDLTSAYFRKACREADLPDADQLTIAYDAAGIVAHPDQSKNAIEVWKLGGIGYGALREATNQSDDDAQTPEDREQWLKWLTKGAAETEDGTPVVEEDEAGPESAAEVEPEPPEQPDQFTAPPIAASAFEMKIIGAAEAGVIRCRALAGARLRSRSERQCGECFERLKPVAQSLVASSLGAEQVRSIDDRSDRELVAGGAEEFQTAVEAWGVAEEVAAKMGEMIERHAAKTLYAAELSPLPVGFSGYVGKIPAPLEKAA